MLQLKNFRRPTAQQCKQACQWHPMLPMQYQQRNSQRGFEAGNSIWRSFKLLLFFMDGMGRVIGRNRVHRAVEQSFYQRSSIFTTP